MKRFLPALGVVGALAAAFLAGRLLDLPGEQRRQIPLTQHRVGGLGSPTEIELPELAERPIRKVILMVADGLGGAQTDAAGLRAFGPGGRFLFERFPVVARIGTTPARGLVTSSDAAATAIASGHVVPVGRIGETVESEPLPTILEAMRAGGAPAGLVTSERIYDATPASFATHVNARKDYQAIVAQLAVSGVEVLAGGGVDQFLPAAAGRDLLAEARQRDVTVARTVAELAAADRLPLWALFPGRTLGETADTPPIGELAERAIELLAAEADRRGTGFFLLIEEEAPDSSGHRHDLERLAHGLLRFDRAVEAAVRFAIADGETLVVVVADHATGGLTIDDTSSAAWLRVAWTSAGHTGERVPLYAYGPPAAARRFAGVYDNAGIAPRLAELLGVDLVAGTKKN